MPRRLVKAGGLALLAALVALAAERGIDPRKTLVEVPPSTCALACGEQPAAGCTVFTLAKGDQVFFGGNDDYIHPDSYYWVDPGEAGKFGAIWVGTPDNVQQGVNEMGLAYDANGLPRVDTNPHLERKPVYGGYTSYPIQILRESATVAEAIDWVQTHQWHATMHDQMQFADAGGDAVIISAGSDGELVFTRKPPGDGFLVSTNFNVADPSNGFADSRYTTAQRVLGELLERSEQLRAADAASVLEAVHVEGGTSWTIASLLADLPNGKVYLYYFYQFDRPVVLDVAEQLSNPLAPGPLSQLFPQDVQQEAARRYQSIQGQTARCRRLGTMALGALGASLGAFLVLSKGREGRQIPWAVIMLALGPLGLLIWGLTEGRAKAKDRRSVLVEVAGDLTPTVMGFVGAFVAILLLPAAQSSVLLQAGLFLGLPVLMGLLLFHGPMLAHAAKQNYLRVVWRRLPHVMVSANLGLAGVNVIAAPLISLSLTKCAVMPLQLSLLGTIWGIAVMGALAGGLLLCAYQVWAVRRGFNAWSTLAEGGVGFTTPTWGRLWWWVLLTVAVLAGAILISLCLQGMQSM